MKMCHPAIIDQDFSPTSTTSCQQQPKQKKNVLTELLMVLNRTAIVIINIEDQSPTPAMLAILTSFQTRHVVRLLHPDNPSEERERERERGRNDITATTSRRTAPEMGHHYRAFAPNLTR
jgi:hypothetical protein